jgi:hypothetical protein
MKGVSSRNYHKVYSWRVRRSGKAPTTDPTLTYAKKTLVSDMHAAFDSM